MHDNEAKVSTLYKALSNGDKMEGAMIASDLEWWFHGPQDCHYMMKMLTGNKNNCNSKQFKFEPRSIDAIGAECVIVEGWEGAEAYWVHFWTLKDGVITQFREYFNTWLIVKDVKPQIQGIFMSATKRSKSSILWQSHPRDLAKRSLPGIMLAI
ncbi:hypothetical protein Leryth_021186 [Lithospermum erythrorhizon]|nr:hypothetical protein Leryth_021186 [Lithospermum erythrorhizon]